MAVRWSDDRAQYRCGALREGDAVLRNLFPARLGGHGTLAGAGACEVGTAVDRRRIGL